MATSKPVAADAVLQAGPKIVVIGGGTGSFMLLSALRNYVNDLIAIVTMSDDGGSTGMLRDELGALPPGDVRQCLVALSNSPEYMRRLLNYRFGDGALKGHAFGNLFLTALEKISGSFSEGVKLAEQVLDVTGRVLPVTTENVRLVAVTKDGKRIERERVIREHYFKEGRPRMQLEPAAQANPEALQAIRQADLVIIGPGDLHPSLIPALLPRGMAEAIIRTKAKKIFIANLVNKPYSTAGMRVHDYVDEITRHIGKPVFDYVIYNTATPDPQLAKKYIQDGEEPVGYDLAAFAGQSYTAVGEPLLAGGVRKNKNDALSRSLIRHDGDRLARIIMRIYFS